MLGLVGGVGISTYCTYADSSYWDIETTGASSSALGLGTGKKTSEMYQKSTYVNWDFNNIWDIDEGKNYPYLIAG